MAGDDSADAGDESADGNGTGENGGNGENGTDENAGDGEDESEPEPEPETATELTVAFVDELGERRFARASELSDGIAAGNLEQFWMGYTAVHGEFEELLGTAEPDELTPQQERQIGQLDVVDATISFADRTDELRVAVDGGAVVFADYNSEYERPDYVDRGSFTESSVTVSTGDCPLDGIATIPTPTARDADEVPGVVLVHGSGPADMDYASYGTRMFADLATGLASRGIATLRYDKRTAVCAVDPEDHTLDHVTVDDALAAIDELRALDGVDPDRIVVAGHSMGGKAAPRILDRDGELAGAAVLAAPARPMFTLFEEQYEHFATVGDYEWPEMETAYEQTQAAIERVQTGAYDRDEILLEYPGALWASLEGYDPVETARAVDEPLFFLQGSRDYQVTLEDDFELWERELAERPDTTFETYDGLDHRFMSGDGPSVSGEYMVRNNVERAVVDDLADWVAERYPHSRETASRTED
ncbi:alpha/beta hydrolase family protein [Natronolimnohabitans innermongolicus]|uniref:AB hydrolase-1 domain-containing protein n=1 Tax=Natronolimnohabitans innermongolicus JCM 12255 TaxID=1227499 RepID=L9XKN0_9EURY|nr:alpha/beta hydrolase [Natronolimnohabitans innermongolicus]ELY61188.1 hypothetical protein C493_02703 [Natronolimnohabitans innermongolicus JCM 12255]